MILKRTATNEQYIKFPEQTIPMAASMPKIAPFAIFRIAIEIGNMLFWPTEMNESLLLLLFCV